MLATTFFQSLAKPIPSIVITFLRQILFLIPFIYLFPLVWDINGIFMAQPQKGAVRGPEPPYGGGPAGPGEH